MGAAAVLGDGHVDPGVLQVGHEQPLVIQAVLGQEHAAVEPEGVID